MDFRRGHRVTNVFRKRSQGHGRISAVTNCDPGRGRMHCAYGSDHPLLSFFESPRSRACARGVLITEHCTRTHTKQSWGSLYKNYCIPPLGVAGPTKGARRAEL